MLKKFYMALITILCSLGITIAISYAWFLNDTNVDPIAQGMAGTAYFAYGDGSSENKAYGINTPRHLYNLAWLSYLYPNQYANKYYEIDSSLNGSLNMDGWTLPPIGKDNSPFTGFFNGNGKTIEKLTVSNDISSMSVKPNTDSIPSAELNGTKLVNATSIGFFGNISGDGTTQVHDFYLDNAKIETKASSTCAGIVAGYVDGKIENVGVISSGLDLGNTAHSATHGSNVSDYTVVGYATEDYTTTVANSKTIIYNPTTSYSHFNYRGMGSQTDWGGSIDMSSLYTRINSSINNTSLGSYTRSEIRYYDRTLDPADPNYVNVVVTSTTTTLNHYYKSYSDGSGSYLTQNKAPYDGYDYLTALYKDVIIIEKTTEEVSGYLIKDQATENYLSFDDGTISNETKEEDATVWVIDNDSHLYAFNPNDGYKYYLQGYNNSIGIICQTDNTSKTQWTIGNNSLQYNISATNYNLKFFDGTWTTRNLYYISYVDGLKTHYLSTNQSAVVDVVDTDNTDSQIPNNADIWEFEFDGANPNGKIHNSNGRYLSYNNGLVTVASSNSAVNWTNTSGTLHYNNNYIKCDTINNEWGIATPNQYYVSFKYNSTDYYLTATTSSITSNITNQNNATLWTFDNDRLYFTNSGINYYLYGYIYEDNGDSDIDLGVTSNVNDATNWYYINGALYTNVDGVDYLLEYDNTYYWSLNYEFSFYLSYGNNYLAYDSSVANRLKNVTSISNATLWTFSSGNINSPSGTISYNDGYNTYYLRYNDNTLSASTTNNNNSWTNDGNGLHIKNNYIQCFNGLWVCGKAYYLQDNNTNNYLSLNENKDNVTNIKNQNDATLWFFSDNSTLANPKGYLFTVVGGTAYYLNYNTSSNNKLTVSTTRSTSWLNAGSGIYYNNNYIQFRNGYWIAETSSAYYISYTEGGVTHYLSTDGIVLFDRTNQDNATIWTFSTTDNNASGTISVVLDNSKLYLEYYNNEELRLSSTSTSWLNSGSGIYNSNSYIQYYNGLWVCGARNTISMGGNYLSIQVENGVASIINTTNSANATKWFFSNNTTVANPKGFIYTVVDSTVYYLNNSSTLLVENSKTTLWENSSNKIYIDMGSYSLYLQYKNNIWQATQPSTIDIDAYYISYNGNYLSIQGSYGSSTITKTTDVSNATKWEFGNNSSKNGYLYTYQNGNQEWLKINNRSLTISTSQTNSLTNDNNKLYYRSGNYHYYIYWSNSSFTGARTRNSHSSAITLVFTATTRKGYDLTSITALTLGSSKNTSVTTANSSITNRLSKSSNVNYQKIELKTNQSLVVNNSLLNASLNIVLANKNLSTISSQTNKYTRTEKEEPAVYNYIPLNTTGNVISKSNTGYLMSGGHSGSSGSLANVDIRLAGGSTLYTIDWGLSTSVNEDGTIKANKVYTYDGTEHVINDSTNTYQKFASSKSDMQKTLVSPVASGNAVGGIHFITSSINKNRVVIAPKVLINGTYYSNYEMPENSFNFNLKKKGYINFFAGLYYPGNQSFFSLHKVERDSNQGITQIKRISKIYGTNNKNDVYIYLYTDGTYSGGNNSLPSGYSQIFDCSWIESPNFTNWDVPSYGSNYKNNGAYMKKLYYFEIPVNDGEYCLGSVDGLDGGYLMYLDIGANASVVDRTEISQKTVNNISKYTYVNGIQILQAPLSNSTNINATDSIVSIVTTGTTGTVVLNRTGNTTITISQALDVSYCGYNSSGGITVSNGNLVPRIIDSSGNLTATGASIDKVTDVLKFLDFNNGTDSLYSATIKKVTGQTVEYEIYSLYSNGQSENRLLEDTVSKDAEYGLLVKGTSGNDIGYGVPLISESAPTDLTNVNDLIESIDFRNAYSSDVILEYYYKNIPGDYSSISEVYTINTTEVTSARRINNNSISSNTDRLLDGDYFLQHVYRMTGNSITISIVAPNGATTANYNATVYISIYSPNNKENNNDDNPGYVFTINENSISSVNDTVAVTASASSS